MLTGDASILLGLLNLFNSINNSQFQFIIEGFLETPRNRWWRRDFGGLPKIEGVVEGLLKGIFLG